MHRLEKVRGLIFEAERILIESRDILETCDMDSDPILRLIYSELGKSNANLARAYIGLHKAINE